MNKFLNTVNYNTKRKYILLVVIAIIIALSIFFVAKENWNISLNINIEIIKKNLADLLGVPSKQGDNIALGASYTMSPTPTNRNCADSNDAIQLTDGQYTKGYFWTQLSTVCWHGVDFAEIKIDLGQIQPIQGLSFNTAADGRQGGGDWPYAINVLVSDDGVDYYNACELTTASAAKTQMPIFGKYKVHKYWTDMLVTHGRYVKILVSSEYYIFVDEIEVYRGSDDMLSSPFQGAPITNTTAYIRASRLRSGIMRRVNSDEQNVWSQVEADTRLSPEEKEPIKSKLTEILNKAVLLREEDLFWPGVNESTFKAILPINELDAQIFQTLAMLWRAQGRPDLTVWQTPLWDPLTPTQTPKSDASSSAINVTMMQNEFRAGSFNLSNATASDLKLNVRIEGLPGGTNPAYINVQDVIWTDTLSGIPVAAALIDDQRAGNGFLVTIPSGMTQQVWLTFHPSSLASGTYNGTVVVDAGTSGTFNIPIELRVSALKFPAQPTLSLGGWDFTDRDSFSGMTLQNRDAFIANLREHFVDTTWAWGMGVMPDPVNFTAFDAWARRWPGVRNYRLFLNARSGFHSDKMGTDKFNKAVGVWISAYVAHWKQMGLKPSQFGFSIVDEPSTSAQSEIIIAWANAIRAANTGVLIWEDPGYADPASSLSVFEACDILCLKRGDFLASNKWQSVYRQQRDAGKTLNFYSCYGPARRYDPYSYYRLQAWTSWNEGATGMDFWAFGDTGGVSSLNEFSSWNEYSINNNYTPLFLDSTTVTDGKQMESIREGVEDYEYLAMLKKKVDQLDIAGILTEKVVAAKTLLNEAAGRVLNASGANKVLWADTKDRNVADGVRIELLNMLESLSVIPIPTFSCGDESCNGSETCTSCPADCGVCTPPPTTPSCGDENCNGSETCSSCVTDCGVCPPVPLTCGDESCNGSETCSSCPADCGACPPPPPPVCGDGNCNGSETCSSCVADCGVCTSLPTPPTPPPASTNTTPTNTTNTVCNSSWMCGEKSSCINSKQTMTCVDSRGCSAPKTIKLSCISGSTTQPSPVDIVENETLETETPPTTTPPPIEDTTEPVKSETSFLDFLNYMVKTFVQDILNLSPF